MMQRNHYKISVVMLALCLAALAPAQGQSLKIIFAGDLMGHTPQHKAALKADGTYDYAPCFRYVKDYIQSADLAIINLEVTLAGPPYTGYPQFSSPRELAVAAQEAGFDVMTTANNHCMDRGKAGLERTLRVLDTLGIPHLGTYRNREQRDAEHPLILDRNGFRLALLTYTYGTNGIPAVSPNIVNLIDTVEMARDLAVARSRGADFVITLIHWGIEYAVKANAEQEQTARWLLEHGCDAVIGGHPHVNTDGGIMVELTLSRLPKSSIITQNCRYLPYWVYRGTIDSLYQYYILPSTDAAAFPELYQVGGDDLKALQLFDRNTRVRLEACALPDGSNIAERLFYHAGRPIMSQRAPSEPCILRPTWQGMPLRKPSAVPSPKFPLKVRSDNH